jgi:hypothetical protein
MINAAILLTITSLLYKLGAGGFELSSGVDTFLVVIRWFVASIFLYGILFLTIQCVAEEFRNTTR